METTNKEDSIAIQEPQEHRLELRTQRPEDYPDVAELMDEVYKDYDGAWPEKIYQAQLAAFPDGQICIEDKGKVIACAFTIIVDYEKFGDAHTWEEITGDARLTTHDPDGDVLYGVDVMVAREYRNLRLGRRLYEARKELCRNLNLKSIMAGGRIPNYRKYAKKMTPDEYIAAVKSKDIYDPTLSFQLSNGFEVKRLLKAYWPEDKESMGYATLLQWYNIHYDPEYDKLINTQKSTARIGCVQWQMRYFDSVDDFLQAVESFVDSLSDYQCDLALFPELFNAPLIGLNQKRNAIDDIWALAGYSEEILSAISAMAVSYNINIIAGSMPIIESDELYNVSYLCRRDGTVDYQYKIHPTPMEKKHWVMRGGNELKAFDTDFGRIGILICYDVEFPELSRLLGEEEVQILLVPFWTDTKNGYLRVQRCAQARAIENECYVAIAGSVGNLPKVENVDIQYGQTAVYSPSDFAFPHDAIISETTPNTEMTLIVDLDLEKLKVLRNEGSVRNFLDRRRDLYNVVWKGKPILQE